MLSGRAGDIKKHKWFEGLDWEALEARKVDPQRKPKDDSSKRLKELTVGTGCLRLCARSHWWLCCWGQRCGALHTDGGCTPRPGSSQSTMGCSLWPVCCCLCSRRLHRGCLLRCSCILLTTDPVPAVLIGLRLHRHRTHQFEGKCCCCSIFSGMRERSAMDRLLSLMIALAGQ